MPSLQCRPAPTAGPGPSPGTCCLPPTIPEPLTGWTWVGTRWCSCSRGPTSPQASTSAVGGWAPGFTGQGVVSIVLCSSHMGHQTPALRARIRATRLSLVNSGRVGSRSEWVPSSPYQGLIQDFLLQTTTEHLCGPGPGPSVLVRGCLSSGHKQPTVNTAASPHAASAARPWAAPPQGPGPRPPPACGSAPPAALVCWMWHPIACPPGRKGEAEGVQFLLGT